MEPLSPVEEELLRFAAGRWQFVGAQEEAVRKQFGLSLTRYHQQLNAVIEKPAALAFDPSLVKRLLRLRESRAQGRSPVRRGAG